MTNSSSDFYQSLPVVSDFRDVFRTTNYAPAPDDWHIVLSDITNSTKAVERGLYKEVNVIGASLLIALFNELGTHDIPFVFGGDGSTVLLSSEQLEKARKITPSIIQKARDGFDLTLRVGSVPISSLRAQGYDLQVSRFQLSPRFSLANFHGEGLTIAEKWIKTEYKKWALTSPTSPPKKHQASFKGLECRWLNVPSPQDQFLSIIVKASHPERESRQATYRRVLDLIHGHYQDNAAVLAEEGLRVSTSARDLHAEVALKSSRSSGFFYQLRMCYTRLESALGRFMMEKAITTPPVRWGDYRKDLIENSDHRKFDEALRMILPSTPQATEKLRLELEALQTKGELTYGLHVTEEAIVTCLIFERAGGHLHFIDGHDGGYVMAAKQMKAIPSKTTTVAI